MKLVTINNSLLTKYRHDSEILQKSTRPYVLVIRLKYKNEKYDFAIPIRSNIPASAPKNQYFALPPRPQTRPKNRHGLHYIKMFPVTKQYLIRYRMEGNNFATLIQNIIDKNSRQIRLPYPPKNQENLQLPLVPLATLLSLDNHIYQRKLEEIL